MYIFVSSYTFLFRFKYLKILKITKHRDLRFNVNLIPVSHDQFHVAGPFSPTSGITCTFYDVPSRIAGGVCQHAAADKSETILTDLQLEEGGFESLQPVI